MHSTAAAIHDPLLASFLLKTPELCAIAPPIAANGAGGQGKNKQLPWPVTQASARLDRRHQIAKMLSALLDIVSSAHTLAPVLTYIVTQTGPLLDTTAGALYRLDDDHAGLALQSSCGLPTSFATLVHLALANRLSKRPS